MVVAVLLFYCDRTRTASKILGPLPAWTCSMTRPMNDSCLIHTSGGAAIWCYPWPSYDPCVCEESAVGLPYSCSIHNSAVSFSVSRITHVLQRHGLGDGNTQRVLTILTLKIIVQPVCHLGQCVDKFCGTAIGPLISSNHIPWTPWVTC